MTMPRILQGAGLIAGLGAAGLLFAPWGRSGEVDRSSIELLRSATVLDVLGRGQRTVLIAMWLGVIVLAAGALVALSWGRQQLAGGLLIPIGPALSIAAVVVMKSPLAILAGAWASTILGLTATSLGGLLLIGSASGGRRSR